MALEVADSAQKLFWLDCDNLTVVGKLNHFFTENTNCLETCVDLRSNIYYFISSHHPQMKPLKIGQK